jgi:TPR repeat protein
MFESYLADGRLYREGRGVAKDARKTYQWCVRAIVADQYTNQAALMIFDGPSDVVDAIPAEERLQWDKTAFDGGVMLAGLRIAETYEKGRGTPRNPLEAAYWYSMVVSRSPFENKRTEAQEGLARLAPELTPAQHATLRQRLLAQNLYYY